MDGAEKNTLHYSSLAINGGAFLASLLVSIDQYFRGSYEVSGGFAFMSYIFLDNFISDLRGESEPYYMKGLRKLISKINRTEELQHG